MNFLPPIAAAAHPRLVPTLSLHFFAVFPLSPLFRRTLTDLYQICRSAGLRENSLAMTPRFTNLLRSDWTRTPTGTVRKNGLEDGEH